MNKIFPSIISLLLIFIGCKENKVATENRTNSSRGKDPMAYVDPNIGTAHSRWFFYTPAAVPFGMAKLGPSTNGSYGNVQGWEAVGYDERHESIEGFANLHEFQVGGFLFTGMTGDLKTIPGSLENPDEGYRSRFNKEDEYARPGYYKVKLLDYEIEVELTATKRVGFQKYIFPKNEDSYLIFDVGNQLGESGEVKDASVSYNKETNTIEGWVITYPEYVKKYQPDGEVHMFFSGVVSKTPSSVGTFKSEQTFADSASVKGKGAGLFLKFSTEENESIEIKTGFSYTSIENARKNYSEEASNLNFEMAKNRAEEIWSEELNKINITDSSEVNKTKFYTGLYHALLGRGLASDVNGSFPENDGTIGQIPLDQNGKPEFNFYNTDSVWGAYWNLTQLWALVWPEYFNDFVQTHLLVYKNSGWLGDGLANSKFVSGVGTNFVGLVIASAYQAGIRDYDIELAFKAAYENEMKYKDRNEGAGKTDLGQFVNKGYIDYVPGWETTPEGSGFSVSHALEYSYSSYAVAQFAKALGKEKEYKELMELSDNWKNIYDEEIDFVRPKLASGEFLEDFDPFQPWAGFQEGNAWQYTFYVPHTPRQLVNTMGEEKFVKRLDSIFTVSEKTKFGGEEIDAFAGVKYLYNQGNQPNLHIAWLFNFTDHPWLTQKWVRKICNDFYGTEGIHGYGYGQDEDQGQLGSWYVMSSMGLFDVKGLTEIDPSFQIGSPLFDKIVINNGYGNNIVITTENNKPGNYYLQSIRLNGEQFKEHQIKFSTLKNGATINMTLGEKPNEDLFLKW
ncbi:GH92 family glycosyl hydrolase [Autumnicola musiva]|uniref:GH92 family glycosyl hydrolase n=1 Tax=Autumnicola musiva TaxID=3075589 RepID=A0ABU3D8W2_9FLAO|nr:GH92 family glycosyl hydrolase [Zunongwangia sp. F117]MDT0677886.1 GH92 family glycosyl hydrolase [Zunongwangia sp. F117]